MADSFLTKWERVIKDAPMSDYSHLPDLRSDETKETDRLHAEIARLSNALRGAEIALARDSDVDGAMKIILAALRPASDQG